MANEPPTTSTKKSRTGLIVTIIAIVVVVLLALFFGLYFGLRNSDEPDDITPDPDIVEPGPEDPDSTGDDTPEHSEHSLVWEHDEEGHWQVCIVCGETTTKEDHELSYTDNNDGETHTISCEICGYEITGEHTFDGYINDGDSGHHQVCIECEYITSITSHDLGSYISDGDSDHHQECSMCDYKSEGNHVWIETSRTSATCTEGGEIIYTCELCNATKTTTIAALGHNWSGEWSYDSTNHWHVCTRDGCTAKGDEAVHALGEQILGEDGYYQTCSVCGYTTAPEEAVPTYWKVETTSDLIIETTNSESSDPAGTLDLDEYVSITIYDQYGGVMSGSDLDDYTVTSVSGNISVSGHTVTSTQYETGTASVTLTSSVVENATADLTITLTQKTYNVTTITIDGSYAATHTVEWGGSYTPEIVVSPTWANNQSYEITGEGTLFTYDESTGTFTHNKTHSGDETFTVTALDGSGVTATLTLTAEPEILEPQSASFNGLEGTYEKGTVINNLDSYLRVNFDENDHQEGDFIDDTCTAEYTSSNTNVVTIDNSAKTATCVGTGTATITATITPDHDTANPITTQSGTVITVKLTATELTINQTSATLDVGDTLGLSVTLGPSGYTVSPSVTWSVTQGSSYVSLSQTTGTSTTATAVSTGTAVVTASADGCNSVTCEIVVGTYGVFATDSWKTINKICTNGEASTYYHIGDTKTITISSESHSIRIIGFDHDGLTTNDSSYNKNSGKAAITVEMTDCLNTTYHMNTSDTTSGGWNSCAMRSYLSDTVLTTLDSDLKSVIKKVDKKATDGSNSSSITTSSDSLFLLARIELDKNSTNYKYGDEGTTYEYWNNHTSSSDRVKTINGSATSWWLRSPSQYDIVNFHYISSSGGNTGNTNYDRATTNHGVSFAFCI